MVTIDDCLIAIGLKNVIKFNSPQPWLVGRMLGHAGAHSPGDLVIFRIERDDYTKVTVERPYARSAALSAGLLTGWLTCINVPAGFVERLDTDQIRDLLRSTDRK